MRTLFVCAVLAGVVLVGCGSGASSEGDTAAVQTTAVPTTAKPQLTAVEIGAAFAYYSAQELKASGQTDPTWSNPAATGKAVLDYCHDLGVTTVAAADEAFLEALTELTVAGYARKRQKEGTPAPTPAQAQERREVQKEFARTYLDTETAKAKAYCPE